MFSKSFLKRKFAVSAKAKHFIDMELKHGCHNYAPLPVVLSKGQGPYLWDIDGKKYIDCLAGYSAVNQGHCHPKIYEALERQSEKLTITNRTFLTKSIGNFEKYLCNEFGYENVLLMNGGVEGAEAAVKFSRRWGVESKGIDNEKVTVLFASNNFWGRSLAACASSDDKERYSRFGPFKNLGFEIIEYNNIQALENKLKENPNVASFMIEPIQGEAGVIIPSNGYLRKCRELCDKYNVLLIFDEIQTGCGRAGKLLACDYEGVRPDLLVLGKSLSGGYFPISACLGNEKVLGLIKYSFFS